MKIIKTYYEKIKNENHQYSILEDELSNRFKFYIQYKIDDKQVYPIVYGGNRHSKPKNINECRRVYENLEKIDKKLYDRFK